jgi:hypothetical protein
MSDNREPAVGKVLDSETFERLPHCQELPREPVQLIDSETSEPRRIPAPEYGSVERLRVLIQRAFEAELQFYGRVFGLPDRVL